MRGGYEGIQRELAEKRAEQWRNTRIAQVLNALLKPLKEKSSKPELTPASVSKKKSESSPVLYK